MTAVLYMLDTDIASYAIKQREPNVGIRLRSIPSTSYCVSVITRSEMLYGLHQAPSGYRFREATHLFLDRVQTLPWTAECADVHSRLRSELKSAGTLIDTMDLLIAAHAISLGATLVTNNVKHFGRLHRELTIENWVTG